MGIRRLFSTSLPPQGTISILNPNLTLSLESGNFLELYEDLGRVVELVLGVVTPTQEQIELLLESLVRLVPLLVTEGT